MNKEEKLKINKMLREKDIDDKLEIYLSPNLYCYVHNYIADLKIQLDQLTNNWNELEEWLESNWKDTQDIWYVKIINKMKEIKESSN